MRRYNELVNPPAPGSRRNEWIGAAAAAIVLAWRIAATGVGIWKDWLALLALHAIFTIFFLPRTRIWTAVTVALMLGLLILYGKGHLPRAVAAIGIER